MADSLCGVPCRGSHGSAHNGVGGETAVEQVLQQAAPDPYFVPAGPSMVLEETVKDMSSQPHLDV